MPRKKLIPPKKKSTRAKKSNAGRKMMYDKGMIETAVNIIFAGGEVKDIVKTLGIANATYHSWTTRFPEFGDAVSRARVEFRHLKERKFHQEVVSAFVGLNELLTGHVIELKEEHSSHIYDEETDKKTSFRAVKTVIKETYVRADMKAIEKVLGTNDIRHNVYLTALEEDILNGNEDLYKMVFGKLPIDDKADEFAGIYALRPHLDLVKLRYMEAHIQAQYDKGNITIDQWMDYTDRIRKSYIFVSAKLEDRAQKLLDGRTYSEIVEALIDLWKSLLEATAAELGGTFKTVTNKKYTIPKHIQHEVAKRIKKSINERREKELFPLQRLPG